MTEREQIAADLNRIAGQQITFINGLLTGIECSRHIQAVKPNKTNKTDKKPKEPKI